VIAFLHVAKATVGIESETLGTLGEKGVEQFNRPLRLSLADAVRVKPELVRVGVEATTPNGLKKELKERATCMEVGKSRDPGQHPGICVLGAVLGQKGSNLVGTLLDRREEDVDCPSAQLLVLTC
jgi:hypothetical protein